jgi:predicted CopG family antitoxin
MTTIKLSSNLQQQLASLKIGERDTYEEVIERLIKNQKNKTQVVIK